MICREMYAWAFSAYGGHGCQPSDDGRKEIRLSFPRKRESRARRNIWIPIFMGMTERKITL